MNELESALFDKTNEKLDFYLEITPTKQIRQDIEEMLKQAVCSTEAGKIKLKLQELIDSI